MSKNTINAGAPTFPDMGAVVTPSDSVDFSPSAIKAGVGGTVRVSPAGAPSQTVDVLLADGDIVPFLCVKVHATGTTAASIVRAW